MSYTWFLISAHILHSIPIFILHLPFLSTSLPSLHEHNVKSSLSISPCHDHELTLSSAYTEYSIHQVHFTPSTAYTEYNIHRVQHTLTTTYTDYNIQWVQHTPSTAYTEYSTHPVQHTLSTAYTEYSIHPRLFVVPSFSWITSWPMNVPSDTGMHPYTIDRHQLGLHKSAKVKSPCHFPTDAS